ncbi:hypothetical protein JHK85_034230 [Glycine max]|nr:hypothetical protein JHK85_034230 [Glycine max]
MCYKQDWIGGLTAGFRSFREHEYEDSAAKVAGKDQLAEAEKSDIATEFGDDEQKLCFIDEDEKEKHDELVALPPYGSEVFIGGLPRDVGKIGIIVKKNIRFNFQVRLVKDRDTGEHKRLFRRYITGNLRLFIGNVPKSWTQHDFRNVDEGVGPGVETIELIKTLRKAYGALKDSTMVSLAKVNSEYKELYIAIVKATSHVEYPPKERHARKIFYATSSHQPRADVAYCIHTLAKRLSKTRNWIVAIKTLIVIHRILREGDPTFKDDLITYAAWDCSAWVRTYALFLEEKLEYFRILRYDIEAE